MSDVKISDDFTLNPFAPFIDTDIIPGVRQGGGSPAGFDNGAGTVAQLRIGILGTYAGNAGLPLLVTSPETGVHWAALDLGGPGITGILPRTNIDTDARLTAIAAAVTDESTGVTTGTNIVKFINPYPYAIRVQQVIASLSAAQASGSLLTIDVKFAGSSIFTTLLSIDNTETNSSTAVTQSVLINTGGPIWYPLGAYNEVSIDVTQIGDGSAKGLKVYLVGYF